jgi:hypothetical protein
MPKDRRVAVLTLLAVSVLAGAGCGGGPSKDDYVADFNEICQESNEKIQKIKRPRTIKDIAPFMRESRGVLEGSIKEAENLELPDEDKEQFESYIKANRESLNVLDDIERASAKNDVRGVRRLFAQTTVENQKRDIQAKKLGLDECGTG